MYIYTYIYISPDETSEERWRGGGGKRRASIDPTEGCAPLRLSSLSARERERERERARDRERERKQLLNCGPVFRSDVPLVRQQVAPILQGGST